MYGVFMVGGQYTWSRMSRLMTTQGWGALDEVRELSSQLLRI
jgi:hypothetical protein